MNRKLLVLVIAGATLATGATAGEIYKYVDEDGNVHYLDRPTGASGEERMAITYTGTSGSTLSSQSKQREAYMAEREERRVARSEQAEAEAQAAVEREERAAKCQQNRSRLESYLQSARLYRENDEGEREYLNESEILEARQKVEELIKEYCS